MHIGQPVWQTNGYLVIKSTISAIYTVNGVTMYDTQTRGGQHCITFDDTAVGTSILLEEPKVE